MTVSAAKLIDKISKRFGYRFLPNSVFYPSQIREADSAGEEYGSRTVPVAETEQLNRHNPRLIELRNLYRGLDEALKMPLVWTQEAISLQDLTQFRGNNMWVYQQGEQHLQERAYLLAAYYILANDRLALMDKLSEDGAFGAITFQIAGRRISRDLLDSILEIDFLDRHLNIASRPDFTVLDIGAGYGRLAHRMLSAFPSSLRYLYTDTIPESSFLCEYYLRFRGLEHRSRLVTPLEIEKVLTSNAVELALNVHSFSECRLDAVRWWLDRLAAHHVRYLMIVPNSGDHWGQILRNNEGEEMLPFVEQSGYKLVVREPKYRDPEVQKFAQSPGSYWLFERKETLH